VRVEPLFWHFNFRGPDVDRLVKAASAFNLDRFWNELSAKSKAIDEATRRHYAKIYLRYQLGGCLFASTE